MNKKLISLLVAICLVIGLLPVVSIAAGTATSATVTLWGNEVTVGVGEAFYWVNGTDGMPTSDGANAENWNYSFGIIDGVPTVKVKGAKYDAAASFLVAVFDGTLKFAYEGENYFNIKLSDTLPDEERYFIKYRSLTDKAGSGHLHIEGAEGALLDVQGGTGANGAFISTNGLPLSEGRGEKLTFTGGKINLTKNIAKGFYEVIRARGSETLIENCELTVIDKTGISGKRCVVMLGSATAGVTVRNSTLRVEGKSHYMGLGIGFQHSSADDIGTLVIEGDSNVYVKVDNAAGSSAYTRSGICAAAIIMKGGSLEVEGERQAIWWYGGTYAGTLDLENYNGQYNMYTDKGGTAVSEYTSTTYLKIEPITEPGCAHTGGTATCTKKAECEKCGEEYGDYAAHIPNADDGDCNTPIVCSVCSKELVPAGHTGGTATCTKKAECEKCGEEYGDYAAHVPNPDDGDFTTPITCSVCDKVLATPSPGGTLTIQPAISMGSNTYKLEKYNEPIYLMNSSSTTQDTAGNEFTGWQPTTTGANEDNYTLKYYWNAGDVNPTIILRGFKWDQFNNETEKLESAKDGNTYTGKSLMAYPLTLPTSVPINMILTGEDSYIEAKYPLVFRNDLSIKSEGTTKLIMNTMSGCIASNNTEGAALTIDANLDLTSHDYYNANHGRAVIHTYKADLTINGGTIVCTSEKNVSVGGITAADGGDIIINGGNVKASGMQGASARTGAILASGGKVIVNNGTVEPMPASNLGIYGMEGIEIKGGVVKFYVSYFGMNAGNPTATDSTAADISITGGLVEIASESGAFYKMPVLGAGITGYAGESFKDVKAYDNEKNFKAKYVKIGLNVSEPDPFDMPTMPGTDPNNPAESPAAPSIEPTASPTAAPGMKLPKALTVKLGDVNMRITKFDEPVYVVNTPTELKDTAGNLFEVIKPTITTDENNWNAKFVWHSNEGVPTLYIDGLIIDDYNEATEKWRAHKQDNPPEQAAHTTAISTPAGRYMRIVATGEDSQIKTRFGINFNSKLRLETEGDTKLDVWCLSSGIIGGAGMPLVVNANLNVWIQSFYDGSKSHMLMTKNGDLIIEGGNINLDTGASTGVTAMYANGGGDVIINSGKITARGVWGAGPTNGTIKSSNGKVIVKDGTLDITAKNAVCIYGLKGIDINGGVVNLTSPYFAISAGASGAKANITFNGGTTTIVGLHACYNQTAVAVAGPGVYAYAGAGAGSAVIYDGTDLKLMVKPWMLFTDDESKKIDVGDDDEDYEDDDDITDPTDESTESTAPTASDPSTAPTASDPSTAPTATDATVPDATTPEDGIPEDEVPVDDNYYNVTPNLNIVEGIDEEIPDALIEVGIDSADMIRDILVEMVWAVDDYSDYFAFFDIKLMYHDGEDWVEANEEHYPEEGYITVMLPYPEGTDMETSFTAVHMFTSDAFGMTPGEVELLAPVNTDEGILVELTGLSPVAIAWEGLYAEENPPTGDTGVMMYVALMVVAVLGMAGTVVLSNKKKRKA